MYQKAILLGAVFGFLIGCVVYWKWRYDSAFWVWVIGICTLGYRMTLGTPHDLYDMVNFGTFDFVSVQCVLYSLGAVCCSFLIRSGTEGETAPMAQIDQA